MVNVASPPKRVEKLERNHKSVSLSTFPEEGQKSGNSQKSGNISFLKVCIETKTDEKQSSYWYLMLKISIGSFVELDLVHLTVMQLQVQRLPYLHLCTLLSVTLMRSFKLYMSSFSLVVPCLKPALRPRSGDLQGSCL